MPWQTVANLGLAQTVAWASSYYLPAMLATPMAADLGVTSATVFAAFSLALLVSALLGPAAGRAIDRHGGRPVLMASNLVFALGLCAMSQAQGQLGLFAAWLLMGLAMGSGLYEAAFATVVRLHGRDARQAITGITLIAGFVRTVGWHLTTLLEQHGGWRGACLAWAGLHLLIALPLNWRLPGLPGLHQHASADAEATAPQADRARGSATSASATQQARARRATALLALVFAIMGFAGTAMAAHLPRLLQAHGSSVAAAVAVGALIGPAQVGARLLEYGLLRRAHPLWVARVAAAMHPMGALALLALGPPAALCFGLLHGAGNGILTIVKGTLPLALFGPQGYGQRMGVLMAPARVAQALAPWLFGLCLDQFGAGSLWLSAALGALAVAALMLVPKPSTAASGAP